MWVRVVLLASAVILGGACVVLPVPQRVVRYPTLIGQLVDADTRAPVVGAVISIGETGSGATAVTDQRGDFELISTGRRFPYTSGVTIGEPLAEIGQVWASVSLGSETRRRRIAQIYFTPPSFADPGDARAPPAELGVLEF